MCAIYISPSESPYYNPDIFFMIQEEINHHKTSGNVLICGDLNAQTGERPMTL